MGWDTLGRQGIDLASVAASATFSALRVGTRLGFAATRGVASAAVNASASVVDYTLFGGLPVARPVGGGVVSTILGLAEQVALAPIFISEYITSASLLAAHSSINVLTHIIPGSSEASFSLASFLTLVRRELAAPAAADCLPAGYARFGFAQIARAMVAWAALQGATREWDEARWLENVREMHVKDSVSRGVERTRRGSRIRVTSDVVFSGNRGQLLAADIGEARAQSFFASGRTSTTKRPFVPNTELKSTLRRLSKLVLAGYGGASLLFFGVSLSGPTTSTASEEANLAQAIDASEAEAVGGDSAAVDAKPQYSWWDVLLGKHDHEIFERYANTSAETVRATAKIGTEHLMPRYWVLTDHSRGQIVLVLRGTMSLNEIAVDLTCEEEPFVVATTGVVEDDPVPGQFAFPRRSDSTSHHAHGGMLRMAQAMGGIGKPVQLAVHEALYHNPGYELVLCGHSLGAGVAGLLGLMWADPQTCLTVHSSGLPVGRRVSVFCFAPPSLVDAALGKRAEHLITSFVYSHDIVARLSLGAVRDLAAAAMWLCEGDGQGDADAASGSAAVTEKAKRWKAGDGGDMNWFISVRKTLEANMTMSNMVPPGRVLWAMRDNDFSPKHRQTGKADKLRLFEVLDVEKVFGQIVFAKDMLSAHLPHQYDRALHELL
ncbi:unnamed protein product [Mycena citricolor]|uniref:sn-1-specific diacylglycerol lipase n=1 Tax=Mycena citricolor TaxID=2018698 RepID=A0AAD2HG94_9AGAR|nr:unnamed protein product [Mycena citricolor]